MRWDVETITAQGRRATAVQLVIGGFTSDGAAAIFATALRELMRDEEMQRKLLMRAMALAALRLACELRAEENE